MIDAKEVGDKRKKNFFFFVGKLVIYFSWEKSDQLEHKEAQMI